jgi:hypothetical protein
VNLPAPRDDRPPVPIPAAANTVYAYCYPLTGPPPASISDATALVQRVLDIVGRLGDELREATLQPYPCALCPVDMARWPLWQQQRHFAQHPLKDRARVVGWLKAVMGP